MTTTPIAKTLYLPDGSTIVLYDVLAAPQPFSNDEKEANVCRLDPAGRELWRISAGAPTAPGVPFTGIGIDDDGRLMAYRWDGTDYEVDVATGVAKPVRLGR